MRVALCAVAVLLTAAAAPSASAQVPDLPGATGPEPLPYGADDGGGFRDVLPSGTRGHYDAAELAAFLGTGKTVPRCCDQLGMYGDLVYATPGLPPDHVGRYFKDATFGVRAGDVERRYSPRPDVTILRDKGFGVPHVYGATRDGAMFGLGYAGAEDRLFFMDVLRHAGRGELAGFAGGSNASMDAEQWEVAPYTEADLQRQADQLDDMLGAAGATIQRDVEHYLAGVNRYIAEAKLDRTKLPGEYLAIGRPQGPDPWKATDVLATAALVGAIFGEGGGAELAWTEIRRALRDRLGRRTGTRVFRNFRSAEDPEAPVTVHKGRFPYQTPVRRPRKGSRAVPDRGSLRYHDVVASRQGGGAPGAGGLPLRGLMSLPTRASNALLVSARESASGRPLMVAGPQTGYFNPQILIEQDVHAPGERGAAADRRARGELRRRQPLRPARPRTRLRLERDLGGPGQHRHVRAAAVRTPHATTATAAAASRSRCSRRPSPGRRRRPTRRRRGRRRCGPSAPSSDSSPRAARCAASR